MGETSMNKCERPVVLTPEQREEFQRNGFVKIPALISQHRVTSARAELDRLCACPELFGENPAAAPRTDANGRSVYDRLEPVRPVSPFFERLTHDPCVVGPVAQLLSDPLLFKEKVIFKPPGTSGYLAHQDFPYWEFLEIPADDILTLMLVFDPTDARNGALELYKGLHDRQLPAPASEPRDVDPEYLERLVGELVCCEPGDAVAFHSLTPHRSASNNTDSPRRAWFSSWAAGRWGNRYEQVYAEQLDG